MEEEEDTKKSFDFTGEISKLDEPGASNRLSFVPLVPTLVDSSLDISGCYSNPSDAFRDMKHPTLLHRYFILHLNMITTENEESQMESKLGSLSASRIIDIKKPTLLPESNSVASSDGESRTFVKGLMSLKSSSSSGVRDQMDSSTEVANSGED